MSDVAQVLADYEVDDLTEADVAEMLRTAFRTQTRAAAAPLAVPAREYLVTHGGKDVQQAVAEFDPAAEDRHHHHAVAQEAVDLIQSTLSPRQVAEAVGRDPSRVRHWMSATPPQVFTVQVGGRRRLPSWQIAEGRLLPHLPEVVAAIPDEVHPLDVATVMTTGQEELDGRTPVQHLAGGGHVEDVTALLEALVW